MSNTIDATLIQRALRQLLVELYEGPGTTGTWILNHDTPGLLSILEALPADVASRSTRPEGKTIAAHANHLWYSLSLLNRWAGGEPNPFATADWEGSWQVQQVTADEWVQLLSRLGNEAREWIAAVQQPREWDEIALTGAFASAAHAAYHMGSIRQMALVIQPAVD